MCIIIAKCLLSSSGELFKGLVLPLVARDKALAKVGAILLADGGYTVSQQTKC